MPFLSSDTQKRFPLVRAMLYSAPMTDARDKGLTLNPKYDDHALITAVVTDAADGEVLMVAHMNAQALALTVETGLAHFWSRSRQALWKKGETSGHMLEVRDIRIDCDQDAVWVKAVPAGPTCHTGARSCFFRRVGPDGLTPVDLAADPSIDAAG
ncbi:Phosphoribosyl-AMP cyclohydrolase [Sphingobium sp. AntQ-1]|nr:Phosphoribosyl-AMP cyclohydrolase [Sphingobium sp. AntQ-1]